RLRPRARRGPDHRAGGARPGADQKARRGGGAGVAAAVARMERSGMRGSVWRVWTRISLRSIRATHARYIFTPGILPSIANNPPPMTAPMIPKMMERMIIAGIAAKVHLMMIATMRQNGISTFAIETRCGATGG